MTTIYLPGQIVRTWRFILGVPGQFTISEDGAVVLFLRSRAGDDPVSCLWALDVASGAERLLADPAELLAGKPAGVSTGKPDGVGAGIAAYATDRAGGLAAFVLAGELWTVEVASGEVGRLPAAGPVTDPRPDPDGPR